MAIIFGRKDKDAKDGGDTPADKPSVEPKDKAMSDARIQTRVIELLASKICHDLVSPVGAIANGMEFIREMGDDAMEDSLALIESSAKQASVKLQLYRLCYGAGGSEQLVSAKMIYEAFLNYIDADKAKLHWDLLNDVPDDLPDGFFKCLLNAMIFVLEALPKGGEITLKDHGHVMTVEGKGAMIKPKEGTLEALDGTLAPDDMSAKNIHAYVTRYFADGFGTDIEHEIKEDGVTVRLYYPKP